MQSFASKVVTEKHKAKFDWAVALSQIRTVKRLGLSVDLRVVEFDLDLIIISCSLQINTFLIIDAG